METFGAVSDRVQYLVYQEEMSPTTGTRHYQTYIQFKQPVKHTAIGTLFNLKTGDYWAAPQSKKASNEAAAAYCKKAGGLSDPVELGKMNKQGKRNDLDSFEEDLKSRKFSRSELYEMHTKTLIRYHTGATKMISHFEGPRSDAKDPRVYVFWGAAGAGKSTEARRRAKALVGDKYYTKTGALHSPLCLNLLSINFT